MHTICWTVSWHDKEVYRTYVFYIVWWVVIQSLSPANYLFDCISNSRKPQSLYYIQALKNKMPLLHFICYFLSKSETDSITLWRGIPDSQKYHSY